MTDCGAFGLNRTDARLKSLLAALPPDMLFVISRQGVFLEYHAPDPELLLHPPSHFVGKPICEVLPPAVAKRVEATVDATLADGQRHTLQYALSLPMGRRWFEATSAVFEAESVVFVVRDRTDLVLAEQHLHLADRLASLGALASGVAHEVNNPLTYVRENLRLIAEAVPRLQDQELDLAVADAIEGVARVQKLVQDLRIFSHPDVAAAGPVNLPKVVSATLRLAEAEIERHAQLVYEPADVPTVVGSDSPVGQVVLNLLSNSLDAMAPGAPLEHELRIAIEHTNDAVELTVSDTGSGVPESLGDRIFDPFVTTKDVGRGTGLGLSISRSIVEAAGGTIRWHPRVPRGTTFIVAFAVWGER